MSLKEYSLRTKGNEKKKSKTIFINPFSSKGDIAVLKLL